MPALGYLLMEAALLVREGTARALAPLGISPREYGILDTLALDGPMTQRALGELRRVDRTSMVALIDALESRGLVVREADPADRRAHALRVTAAGSRVIRQARDVVTRLEIAFLAPVASADRQALKRALSALLQAEPVATLR